MWGTHACSAADDAADVRSSAGASAGWQEHLLSSLSCHPVVTPNPYIDVMHWWTTALWLMTLALLTTFIVMPALHLEIGPSPIMLSIQPAALPPAGLCVEPGLPRASSHATSPYCGSDSSTGDSACAATSSQQQHVPQADFGACRTVAGPGVVDVLLNVLNVCSSVARQALRRVGLGIASLGGPLHVMKHGGAATVEAGLDARAVGAAGRAWQGGAGAQAGAPQEFAGAATSCGMEEVHLRSHAGGRTAQTGGPGPRDKMSAGGQTAAVNVTRLAELEQRLVELLELVRAQPGEAPLVGEGHGPGEDSEPVDDS